MMSLIFRLIAPLTICLMVSIPANADERSTGSIFEWFVSFLQDLATVEDSYYVVGYYMKDARLREQAVHERSLANGRLSPTPENTPKSLGEWARFYSALHGIAAGGEGIVLTMHDNLLREVDPEESSLKMWTIFLPGGMPPEGEQTRIDINSESDVIVFWTERGLKFTCFSYATSGGIDLERADEKEFGIEITAAIRLKFGPVEGEETRNPDGSIVAPCQPFEFAETVTFSAASADHQ